MLILNMAKAWNNKVNSYKASDCSDSSFFSVFILSENKAISAARPTCCSFSFYGKKTFRIKLMERAVAFKGEKLKLPISNIWGDCFWGPVQDKSNILNC